MGKVIVWLLVLALAPITWAGDTGDRERVERSRELSQQLQQQLQRQQHRHQPGNLAWQAVQHQQEAQDKATGNLSRPQSQEHVSHPSGNLARGSVYQQHQQQHR